MTTAIVWSKNGCPFCTRAKRVLEQNNIEVEERNISLSEWTREQLLEDVPTAVMVPQIFINEKYIGGYNELTKYIKEQK